VNPPYRLLVGAYAESLISVRVVMLAYTRLLMIGANALRELRLCVAISEVSPDRR
jgi:hypothetical protein